MYAHLYVSPHYDDAALSCGGRIHGQVRQGARVLVVTVCAAPPPPGTPVSAVAAQIHGDAGDGFVARRRAEDAEALRHLGADGRYLDVLDCIYRGSPGAWRYPSLSDVFGPPHPEDEDLVPALADVFDALLLQHPGSVLYAPLGHGGHVDHRIACRAAGRLLGRGRRVVFYEDYPYADETRPHPYGAGDGRLDVRFLAGLRPESVYLDAADVQARCASVAAYRSQIPALFGDAEEAARSIQEFARRRGGGRPAERYWVPEGR
ncbi:MAG: PIG-L family deacetylase [Rhodothermales bacterium]|nr:PIG-L family deacetylase [Rhodothermales bacterium]